MLTWVRGATRRAAQGVGGGGLFSMEHSPVSPHARSHSWSGPPTGAPDGGRRHCWVGPEPHHFLHLPHHLLGTKGVGSGASWKSAKLHRERRHFPQNQVQMSDGDGTCRSQVSPLTFWSRSSSSGLRSRSIDEMLSKLFLRPTPAAKGLAMTPGDI